MARKDDKEKFIQNHPNVAARQMPNSYEAEAAMLGGISINDETAAKYVPLLSELDFYTPAHKYIFRAMNMLFNSAKAVDFVTITKQLDDSGTLALSGGIEYISNLVNVVPSTANSEYYYGILKKQTRLREMIRIANRLADAAYALDPGDDALTQAEAELYSLSDVGGKAKLELINSALSQALDDIKKRQENPDAYRGVPTGFSFLDHMLGGGFQRSDLIILAARPGQGKTSFAMNCAVNAALKIRPDTKKPYSVAVFSIEMSRVQLARRMMCSVGNFDMSLANKALVDETGWAKLYEAVGRFKGTNLYVDDSGAVTPAEILSKCRRLKNTVGLDFVMIDYLQLMKSGKNIDNMVHEIGEITRALKLAAKELDVPILLLSQMSRGIEKRDDPTPQLSDLRDSGAIEQDADIVMFLDRTAKTTDVENPADDAKSLIPGNTVYLNIAKHRNGETGTVRLVWMPSTVTFKGVSKTTEEPKTGGAGRSDSAFISDNDEPAPPDADDIGL